MSIKLLRNVLMATTGVALAMTLGVSLWGLLGGSHRLAELGSIDPQIAPVPTVNANSAMTVDRRSFEGLWDLALLNQGNEMVEPPKPSGLPIAPTNFPIQFVGMVSEAGRAWGLFRDDRGAMDLKGVGQALHLNPTGVEITHIANNQATIRYEGRVEELPLTAYLNGPATAMPVNRINYGSPPITSSPTVPMPAVPSDFVQPAPEMPAGEMMSSPAGSEAIPEGESVFDMFPHLDPTRQVPPPSPVGSMEAQP